MEEVNRTERELHDAATTRAETDSAWRRAVEGVLLARVLRFIFDGRKAYDTFRHGNGSGDNVRKVRACTLLHHGVVHRTGSLRRMATDIHGGSPVFCHTLSAGRIDPGRA